ncbi:heavy-metal-associated domain-containing protein [Peptostreptococcus russellii]|uniref:Copper chaperone CopZ n=1 Tax=Peptostreptococcus russellii TaxID=215200 RepID=A0A1H8FQG8_9FIRM|nr:heavy metal-associated domain-containing protein [Peptostreptococcus russellii]MBC2577128.1 heavy-metal-associated domain-containing protein [Peptostreptococcus russellii]SEN33953.1 Copper chaperone CopZ [Peptostreptococcus russellii]
MKKRLIIEGMHCENCVKGLNAVLTEDVEGLEVVEINLDGGYADVELDDKVSEDILKDAVEELGFELKEIKNI